MRNDAIVTTGVTAGNRVTYVIDKDIIDRDQASTRAWRVLDLLGPRLRTGPLTPTRTTGMTYRRKPPARSADSFFSFEPVPVSVRPSCARGGRAGSTPPRGGRVSPRRAAAPGHPEGSADERRADGCRVVRAAPPCTCIHVQPERAAGVPGDFGVVDVGGYSGDQRHGLRPGLGAVGAAGSCRVLAMVGRPVHRDRLPGRGGVRRRGPVRRPWPLSLGRDLRGLRPGHPAARRSSAGGRLARHHVPLPPALPSLALAARARLAYQPALGGARLRALLLCATDRHRHPDPRGGTCSLHQVAGPAAYAGPVWHLGRCRLRNGRRGGGDRSLGGASAVDLAVQATGRLPGEHGERLTKPALRTAHTRLPWGATTAP